MRYVPLAGLLLLLACGATDRPADDIGEGTPQGFELPVLVNAQSPVAYPLSLFEREVEASVTLRLYLIAEGTIVPESTKVAESSGYAAFDSAAVAGVPHMQFAPAREDGQAVATLFLQPVHFRHPARSQTGGGR